MRNKQIVESNLTDVISQRFARYAKYIIQDRALPDARDGLKPVQRRILYAMWEDGNTNDKQYRKSVKSVGLVIGNYHPHGESSVYDAMVRMSQSWKVRTPLIDMHGNNGSIDDDPPAAMRYTEARLSLMADYLLKDIEKETVLFAYNFDDTTKEPTVLPTRFPNLLINGINGIAAGYATNIPPHNLNECVEGAIYRIKHPNCSLDEIMTIIKGPDFPTGAIIQGVEGIKTAFESGKGRIVVRSKVEFKQDKTINQLIINEIPYEVVKSKLVQRIDEIRVSKVIDGLLDVRDESDRNGLKIVIDLKKETNHQLILNYLYKHTELQVYYNYNVVAIVDKRPVQIGLLSMLDAFIKHRQEVVYKATQFDLNKAQSRMHIVAGLMKAVDILDDIIALIRVSKDKAESKQRLIDEFDFSELQAEAIVTLRLYRLSNTDITKLEVELQQLEQTIIELSEILENSKKLNAVIIAQLKEINRLFNTPRISVIEEKVSDIIISKEQLINKEQVMVTLSKDGYAKRSSLRSYNSTDGKITLKEEDKSIFVKEMNTLQKMLFFTNQGTYGFFNIYDLPEMRWKEIGNHLSSMIKIDPNEKIVNAYGLTQFNTCGFIILITKKGMIKKTKIADFEVSRNSKTMVSMNLSEEDEVVKALVAYSDNEVLIVSKNGFTTRYPIDNIPTSAPRSKGVRGIKLEDDEIVDMKIINHQKNIVIVFNEQMNSKRLKLSEINLTGRAVKGDRLHKKVISNPQYVSQIVLCNLNDSILFSNGDEIAAKDFTIMAKTSGYSTNPSIDATLVVVDESEEIAIVSEPEVIRSEELEYEIQGFEFNE